MYLFLWVLFSLGFVGNCDVSKRDGDTNQLLGVETKHKNIKINKDTKITRNMKIEHHEEKTKEIEKQERSPDWSYSSIPPSVSTYVEQFKRNMSECLKEVQKEDLRPVKRLSPKAESPVHGNCLIACVMKRNQIIHNGKINKSNLIDLVGKFYAKDTKLMKKLEKNLDSCIAMSIHHQNDCDLAAKLNECTNGLMENNKHKLTVNYK